MLDAFEILTTSGVVVWRKHFTSISPSIINSLINDVFIEERTGKDVGSESAASAPTYKKDRHTLKWMRAKDVGLVFVAVYQSLLRISWVDDLLTAAKSLFLKRYASELKKPDLPKSNFDDFTPIFDTLLSRLDTGSTRVQADVEEDSAADSTGLSNDAEDEELAEGPPAPVLPNARKLQNAPTSHPTHLAVNGVASVDSTPGVTPDTSRPTTPSQPSNHLLTAKTAPLKMSRRAKKALQSSTAPSSGDESAGRTKPTKGGAKQKRRWDVDGMAVEGDDDIILDYSAPTGDGEGEINVDAIDVTEMGSRTGKGQFVLKDLEDEVDAILSTSRKPRDGPKATNEDTSHGLLNSAASKLSGMFRNVVGGKTLTKEDLRLPLLQMQTHLLEKNVAREAADRLCSSVEADLLAQKTASFTSIDKTIRESMAKALTRILTPTSSLDLLRNITDTISGPNARPYVISIVGVNGVGKSTSLSKIAYFLLQNKFRVLVVAGDTFRSGAVEQLRVHVRNLTELSRRENVGTVELFEKGYGKDAATVARDAVTFATNSGKGEILYDVVLIDTAGRRHNDSRLMSSLTKFGQLANPDKIFMVGEALVGTDSVAQARNFAKEFVDTKGRMRNDGIGMDGFIISKCDTVGDMVGTLVSMVHATRIPVVFLGVGQHYGDLRGLKVEWAVDKLMK